MSDGWTGRPGRLLVALVALAVALAGCSITGSDRPTGTPAGPGRTAAAADPTARPAPTRPPTSALTARPTSAPTARPTSALTARPTSVPTARPTSVPTARPTARPTPRATPAPTSRFAVEPPDDWSGGTVALDTLPPEAVDTVELIARGGPYPYRQDDGVFGNREGLLPERPSGTYREYTVETPGSPDRGARRIVVGGGRELYYTDDHYDSFRFVVP
jgi:ribonuclease T1